VIIRLLGPLELTGPNGAVQLGSAGQRTLVARLALKPGETVPRSALVDALWSEEAPPTATKTLHSLLARLRGQIRDAGLGRRTVRSARRSSTAERRAVGVRQAAARSPRVVDG
jgi:DNA-binding SARP family transcriptional activator